MIGDQPSNKLLMWMCHWCEYSDDCSCPVMSKWKSYANFAEGFILFNFCFECFLNHLSSIQSTGIVAKN